MSTKAQTNDFYDDAPAYQLEGSTTIEVLGEIKSSQTVDINNFQKRSLIVKEAILDEDGNKFIGAYRYDGYSLYDILNNISVDKKNTEEFGPIIDQFIVVENDEGDRVIFSWGEVYYPIHRHEIIIATDVARIVPSKTKDLWPLPGHTRIIAGHDLLTERNIANPTRIRIVSAAKKFKVEKGMSPMYSPSLSVFYGQKPVMVMHEFPEDLTVMEYESVFYGRGRGIHSTTPFKGILLKDILESHFPVNKDVIRNGYFIMAAPDGYRGVYTYSEVMNRNDQSEVLVVEEGVDDDGGRYRLFPAGDFFSDRAIKSISGIYFMRFE